MAEPGQHSPELPREDAEEGLRQALLRMTSPSAAALRAEIETLRQQLASLAALGEELGSAGEQLPEDGQDFGQRVAELRRFLKETRARQAELEASLRQLEERLRGEMVSQDSQTQAGLQELESRMADPGLVSERVSPVLVPMIAERARQEREGFAEAVAPVIGPAIRHQIRESRQDIIDSLSPLIGQIIAQAISESFRELTRNIDARLRQQLNLQERFRHLSARLRGVSEAELLMRESLPCSIQHVFLIHRKTGLLLEHVASSGEKAQDLDVISGMLTAIRDFVRDSFGRGEGELEEVTHGDQRILLEDGPHAYLAVVLEGFEPPGYGQRMKETVQQINLQHERELSRFQGEMDGLPDLRTPLTPLLDSGSAAEAPSGPLPRAQKWALAAGLGGIILLLALAAFQCLFTYRLWSFAFPRPSPTSTATAQAPAALPRPTQTTQPTATRTSTPVPTATLAPTSTMTQVPSLSPTPQVFTLSGSLYVRSGPGKSYPALGAFRTGQQVIVLEKQGDWLKVAPVGGGQALEGWVWEALVQPFP